MGAQFTPAGTSGNFTRFPLRSRVICSIGTARRDGRRVECASAHRPASTDDSAASCIELETGAHPDAAVIWLHGLGADGNDFVPIVDEMRLPPTLPIRFVFPHAPVRPVTINNGMPMRAWYDIYAADLANRADMAGVARRRRRSRR